MSKKLEAAVFVLALVVAAIWGALIVRGMQWGTHIHFSNGRLQSGLECHNYTGYLCPPDHKHTCDGDFVLIQAD